MFWRDSWLLDPGVYERPHPSAELVTQAVGRYLVPRACVLHPEQVDEYPSHWDLAQDQQAQVDAWPGEPTYKSCSGPAGHQGRRLAALTRRDAWPDCPAGHAMEHLLIIPSSEYDVGSWKACLPAEDWDPNGGIPREDRFDMALGILLSGMIVFVCYRFPDCPTAKRIQS